MKIIAITPEEDIKDEQHYIALLIAEGFIVHCRKPNKNAVELATYLRNISPEFRSAIAIHNHHELAKDMGINRLHLPEKVRIEKTFNMERFKNYAISTSAHSRETLSTISEDYDYVLCSPVFDSISKAHYNASTEWQSPLPEEPNLEKIALGGITPDKMVAIRNWGFDGAAFSGYLWENPQRMAEKINKIKEVWLTDLTF